MLNQAYRALGYQQITNLAAAVGLTVPAGTTLALITCETQDVRWRDDSTDPTATVGYPLAAGVELQYAAGQIGQLKFIEQAASAKLNITYYGN
jgi:hypothetical protein